MDGWMGEKNDDRQKQKSDCKLDPPSMISVAIIIIIIITVIAQLSLIVQRGEADGETARIDEMRSYRTRGLSSL